MGVVHTSAAALGIKSHQLLTEAHDVFGAIDRDYSGECTTITLCFTLPLTLSFPLPFDVRGRTTASKLLVITFHLACPVLALCLQARLT